MEYLLLAIIFYFILQTGSNLVGLLRNDEDATSAGAPNPPEHEWRGPSPRARTGTAWNEPTFWGEDVEEAKWHDVRRSSEVDS